VVPARTGTQPWPTKTPTFGRSCPIRPKQDARRSLVRRQLTRSGRSAPAGHVTGPERTRQSGGSGTRAAQGRPGGDRQRQPVQKVAAWRKRGAASPPRSRRRVSPWAPGCLKILYGPAISRKKAAIFALDDLPLGNGVATWSVAGAVKQLKVSGLTMRPWLKRP
jgi:hypothetical protein